MKIRVLLMLVSAMAFTFAACGGGDKKADEMPAEEKMMDEGGESPESAPASSLETTSEQAPVK